MGYGILKLDCRQPGLCLNMGFRMRSFYCLAVLCLGVMQGCASLQMPSLGLGAAAPEDLRACARHFSSEGNFLAGRQFKSFEEYPRTTQSAAFDDLLPVVSEGGYLLGAVDRDTGVISANKGGASPEGRGSVLNVNVRKSSPSGVRIDLVYNAPGGILPLAEDVQKEFCRLLEAVKDHPEKVALANGTPEPASMRRPSVLEPTASQRKRIREAVGKRTGVEAVDREIKGAAPIITQIIELHGCWHFQPGENYPASYPLRAYEAPGFSTWVQASVSRPMALEHHAKTSCVSVARIVGWAAPARGELNFEVVYVSDSSGEVRRVQYNMIKTAGNAWLLQDLLLK